MANLIQDSLFSDSVIFQTFVGYLLCLSIMSRRWGLNRDRTVVVLVLVKGVVLCGWALALQMECGVLLERLSISLSFYFNQLPGIFSERHSKILKIPTCVSSEQCTSLPVSASGSLCGALKCSRSARAIWTHLEKWR